MDPPILRQETGLILSAWCMKSFGVPINRTKTWQRFGAQSIRMIFGVPGHWIKTFLVPCARQNRELVIPGRNRCVSGWTEQYHGYLSANLVGHPQATTYVCVDENVELMDAGANDVNGFLMYGVRGHCGSLKCPPYIEGKPIYTMVISCRCFL